MSTVSKKYALALFDLAKQKNQLDLVEGELRVFKQVMLQTPELLTLLQSPKLSLTKKKALVNEVFASFSPYVQNTLKLLVDRHRENEMANMATNFIELANEYKGVAEATVYSTRSLTDSELAGISSAFAPKVGKNSLDIYNKVDSDLLGGLRIRIGNRIYDGSLQGKLERLKRQLIG